MLSQIKVRAVVNAFKLLPSKRKIELNIKGPRRLVSQIIWAMLMVGGSGNNRGAIFGAFVVWFIWSGTQFLPGFLDDPNFRFVMVGVLIVAVILLRPEGILGEERAVSRLPETQSGDASPEEWETPPWTDNCLLREATEARTFPWKRFLRPRFSKSLLLRLRLPAR